MPQRGEHLRVTRSAGLSLVCVRRRMKCRLSASTASRNKNELDPERSMFANRASVAAESISGISTLGSTGATVTASRAAQPA